MKKLLYLSILGMLLIAVSSCSKQDVERVDFRSEIYTLTKADIFVSSEEFQAWSKFMNRDARRMRIIRSKLSQEQKNRVDELYTLILDSNPSEQNIYKEELSGIFGFDYNKRAIRLSEETKKVFAGQEYTRSELLRAQQRHNAYNIKVVRSKSNDDLEQRIEDAKRQQNACNEGCSMIFMSLRIECQQYDMAGQHKLAEECINRVVAVFDKCTAECEKNYPIPTE